MNKEMESTMSDYGRPSEERGIFPLPLVIGVTGHRDLREEDREPLETRVRNIFEDLQSRYPSTPLILLSPLAEGADRLVAKVALAKGVRLIVPLPMPRALYEQDFQSKASRDEFNKLLQHAERCFELSLLHDDQEGEAQIRDLARDRQYAQVGAYVVLHSQILIALWDGAYTDQVGGTSQIVQFQLQGVPEAYMAPHSPLDEPESGPVYHIVTPRIKNPTPVERSFELHKLFPTSSTLDKWYYEQVNNANQHDSNDEHAREEQYGEKRLDAAKHEFDRVLKHLDTFNRDRAGMGVRLAGRQERSKAHLLGNMDTTTLSPDLNVTLDRYADLYATADTLALYFRDRTENTLLFLFGLFFISLFCFDVFAHFEEYLVSFLGVKWGEWLRFLFLFLYLIFLFVAYYIWYYRARRGDYKNKYLDYRALAEGLRVQFFWRLAGLPDTVANHYLRKQKSELDWIRNSIRVANLLCDAGSGEWLTDTSVITPNDRYHLILKRWVYDQRTYFSTTTRRDHERQERNEQWVRGFFLIGIALALALFLLQLLQLFSQHIIWIDNLPPLLIVLMSLALVFAALREGFADKMAYAEQVKQYQRMSRLFWQAFQLLKDSLEQGKRQEVERVIRELGEEALMENGDWVMLHRARPLNVPMGG
jgi:Ca2+/Na+ antiporter